MDLRGILGCISRCPWSSEPKFNTLQSSKASYNIITPHACHMEQKGTFALEGVNDKLFDTKMCKLLIFEPMDGTVKSDKWL